MDRDQVRKRAQLGGQKLKAGYEEARIRHAAASQGSGGSPRRPHHAGAARINTQHELVWVTRRASKDCPAVAGAQVHRHRGVRGGGIGQLTDIDLAETMTDLQLHRQMIIRA
jgi:hypothetical protein